jgi:phage terminase large subunit GpA-like protein
MGSDTAKAEIYGHLRITEPGPGFVLLSKHMTPEAFEQLTAERLVTRYIKGHAKLEWIKPPGRRNEALDCAAMALAAAHFVGVDRWKEPEWSKWEGRIGTVRKPSPVQISPAMLAARAATPRSQPPPRPMSREW